MDGRWLTFAAVAALAAASTTHQGSPAKANPRSQEFGKRLDLTTDRPLKLADARKLKRWWESHGWSVELFKKPRGLFGVVATKVKPFGSKAEETTALVQDKHKRDLEKRLAEAKAIRDMDHGDFSRTKWMTSKGPMEELASQIQGEEGRYGGKARQGWGGTSDHYQLEIKAGVSIPDWVEHRLGPEEASYYISDDRQSELDWFVEVLSESGSSLYQPWFNGTWTTEGRSGGYLLLQNEGWADRLRELADDWPGEDSGRVLGGWSFDEDYLEDVQRSVASALKELAHFEYLKSQVPALLEDFSKTHESDEYWQESLDLTDKQVAKAKAKAAEARSKRRW